MAASDDQRISDLLKRVHRLRLKTRGRVRELFGGAYESCFRGQGMDFDDLRLYEPGDEIRSIDWNVTARQGQPFVKQFIEERELAVYLVVDISRSGDFGSKSSSKREWISEIAALLAFSAARNQDKVALILFSSGIDLFLPPKKGSNHLLRMVREILCCEPSPGMTDLSAPLKPLIHNVPRRSLVFIISDFISHDFVRSMRTVSQRHDVIALQVTDPAEEKLPRAGRIRFHDPETGRQRIINTSKPGVMEQYAIERRAWQENLETLLKRLAVDRLTLETDRDFIPTLHAFFKGRVRNRR